ncbi:MAG TPA: glycoside hydrolase family 2 TIM barrel-domain containing protein, partial [Polyangiaceae bacterium]|nr:glycoside hydrolase family 2 TIM barrel-domain containing protein [Polyangiaceae bacterium]
MSAPRLGLFAVVWSCSVALSCAGGQRPPASRACAAAECEKLAPRHTLSLEGAWQAAKTKSPDLTAPSAAWQPMQVPGVAWSEAAGASEYLWLRREIEVPAAMAGQRLFLRLVGARFHPHVLVDGKLIAERLDGWTPFEVELSSALAPGQKHRLELRCQDWGATFAEGYHLPSPLSGDARSVPKGKVLAPVGGHLGFYGAWEDVEIVGRGTAFATDVAIVPSHREGRLAVSGKVDGAEGSYQLSGVVLDGEREVLKLASVSAAAGKPFGLAAAFPDAVRWSPENPKLYTLRLFLRRASDSALLDVTDESFGFKEVWTEGPDIYLNGVKRHLAASSTWPSAQPQSREEVRAALGKIKAGHDLAFRLHTQPWPQKWLEEADKLGVLIVEEGALWCDSAGAYAYSDPRFWQNVKDHLSGMVRRDRNHPSVFMWSLENEILHCGAERFDKDVPNKLGDVGRFVKQLDPAHLITFEADHDPGAAADVIGLHYPHELPAFSDYPNTADWLSGAAQTGTEGGLMGSRDKAFAWSRQKPLYIGEYLWCPEQDYSVASVFFGPEAYADRERYHRLAQAEAWKDQTLAYRRANVSGFCPWTAFEGGGKVAPILYEAAQGAQVPVAVYLRQKDRRFFAGEKLQRTLEVYNDVPQAQDLALSWRLSGSERQGHQELHLDPAEYRAITVELALPAAGPARELTFEYELSSKDQPVHGGKATLRVEPKQPLAAPRGPKLVVWDADGAWSKQAEAEGLRHRRIAALSELAGAEAPRTLLVVAPGALDVATASKAQEKLPLVGGGNQALSRFLLAGGRALILEQTRPSETLGLEL